MTRLASFTIARNRPNQDSFLALDLGGGRAAIAVADGVGGRPAGEIASRVAVATAEAALGADFGVRMEALFAVIAQKVAAEAPAHGALATTLTLARIDRDLFHTGHAGDTRAFLLSGGEIADLTRDHSLGRVMVDEEGFSEAEVAAMPNRNALVSCIGAEVEMSVDSGFGTARPGDRLLIVSDGVHGVVPREAIAALNAGAGDAQALIDGVRTFVERAGVIDDTTAVAWEFA